MEHENVGQHQFSQSERPYYSSHEGKSADHLISGNPSENKLIGLQQMNYANPNNQMEMGRPSILFLNKNERNPGNKGDFDYLIIDIDKKMLVEAKDFDGLDNDDINDPEVLPQVKEDLDERHPMTRGPDGKLTQFPICSTKTGWIGCGESQAKSELTSLGLGVMIYFKVLKAFTLAFLIIAVINIPLYFIYLQNHKERTTSYYTDALFKTTIGNIGSVLYNCQKIPVSWIYRDAKTYTFTMNCSKYNISSINAFGLTSNYADSTNNTMQCQNFTSSLSIVTDKTCSLEKQLNQYASDAFCFGNKSCTFTVDLPSLQSGCTSDPKYDYFFFSYTCHDNWILLYGNIFMARDEFAFVIVGIDIASIISLFICLLIIPFAQKRTKKFFNETVVQISDYTIHFKRLKLKQDRLPEELNDFLGHIYQVFHHEFPDEKDTNIIYDFAYPMLTDHKLDLVLEKNKTIEEIKRIEIDLKQNGASYSLEKKIKMNQKAEKLRERDEFLRMEIEENDKVELKEVNDIYLTFTNQAYKRHFHKILSRSKCNRCCLIFCFQRKKISHLYFRDKWIAVQESTDQPSNICWENIPFSTCKRVVRKTFSVILAILVLAASFAIVIGAKYAQIEINKKYNPNIDCSQITVTQEEFEAEYKDASIDMRSKMYTHCYCFNYMLENGLTKTASYAIDVSTFPCHNWIYLYLQSESLTVGVIFLVPAVNVILSFLLQLLTEFERNKSMAYFLTANMWKSFVLQFVNTGIILLLVNMNIQQVRDWNSDFPLFTGLFDDLSPSWYFVVGVTILLYMIINILSPHLFDLGYYLYLTIRRGCDRCCARKYSETSVRTRKEYFDLYMGPNFNIGIRYSQLLTTLFVILIYSSGIPILYVCCFLFFLLTYWVDKWLILRFYRTPPNFDLYLASVFNYFILVAVILHLAFGIWIYGNKDVLTDKSSPFFQAASDSIVNIFSFDENSYAAYVLKRVTFSHNIIMLSFLCFVILALLYRIFLSRLCCKSFLAVHEENLKKVYIYDVLSTSNVYYTHQMRKAQYKILEKDLANSNCSPDNVSILKNVYFHNMINVDRQNIKRKLKDLTGRSDFSNIPNCDFDIAIPDVIRSIKKKLKEEIPVIRGDFTYNIAHNIEFRDIAYYVMILPFLKK